MSAGDYVAPNVAVDGIIFQIIDKKLNVLLIQRTTPPFTDQLALPGGYHPAGETTLEALKRILLAKAGIKMPEIKLVEQLYTFDSVARDPRGHAVDVTYMCLTYNLSPDLTKNQHPRFFPVNDLPDLAFDHNHIIEYAVSRLKRKTTHSNVVCALLPNLFTLTQLQNAYEAIHLRHFDKRNFRKKFMALGLIHPTTTFYSEGAHRPARLYGFNNQKLEEFTKVFD